MCEESPAQASLCDIVLTPKPEKAIIAEIIYLSMAENLPPVQPEDGSSEQQQPGHSEAERNNFVLHGRKLRRRIDPNAVVVDVEQILAERSFDSGNLPPLDQLLQVLSESRTTGQPQPTEESNS